MRIPFPSWRYHATERPVIVHSPGEAEALGAGWADTPAAFERDRAAAVETDEPEPKSVGKVKKAKK